MTSIVYAMEILEIAGKLHPTPKILRSTKGTSDRSTTTYQHGPQIPIGPRRCEAGQALSECQRIVIQDGSAFALHNALAQVLPGCFSTFKPAAVALHCTLDVLQDVPLTMVLSPDTDSEHDYLPAPESLRGEMFLADWSCLDLAYLQEIDPHGGLCIVRGKAGLNPRVIDAYREDGQRLKSCQERDVQAIVSTFPKRQRADLEVEWLIDHHPFRLRLIVRWHPQTQSFAYLLTHLPHTMKRCKKRPVKPFYLRFAHF